MPRLPTILVIGSQAISVRPLESSEILEGRGMVDVIAPPLSGWSGGSRPGALRTGHELRPPRTPLGLLVEGGHGHAAQPFDGRAVQADGSRGHLSAGGLVHERHELVGETGHGAADADAPYVRAAAQAVHPAAFGDVALHHRSPAA